MDEEVMINSCIVLSLFHKAYEAGKQFKVEEIIILNISALRTC